MSKETILIIEDDIDLSNIMKDFLSNEEYIIKQAFDGNDGIEMNKTFSPNIIILDIMLPKCDGIEVCKTIRNNSNIPIIIISAKKSDYDKVLALGVGADDYLTKPFSQIELVARVKSHLRRVTEFSTLNKINNNEIKKINNLEINSSSYEVKINNKYVEFSPKEFQLLDFLTSNIGQVFTKEQLIDNIWGYSEFIDHNTIAVYIGRLREKLQKENINNIKTVWGVGYKWEKE